MIPCTPKIRDGGTLLLLNGFLFNGVSGWLLGNVFPWYITVCTVAELSIRRNKTVYSSRHFSHDMLFSTLQYFAP